MSRQPQSSNPFPRGHFGAPSQTLGLLARRWLTGVALGISLLPALPAIAKPGPYTVPLRTDAELLSAARSTCVQARANERPVLVEFSAEWCTDCRAVERLKQAPELRTALSDFESLAINVGRFDRHTAVLQSFRVRAIAFWAVLAPENCDLPLQSWTRIGSRTLEPVSGSEVRSEELASWLEKRAERARKLPSQSQAGPKTPQAGGRDGTLP